MKPFLSKERERLNLKQKEVYESIGVSKVTYYRWENGSPIPSDKLAELGKLGFDITYLVTGQYSQSLRNESFEDVIDVKSSASHENGSKMLPENLFYVPLLNVEASAGQGAIVVDREYSEGSMIFDNNWLAKRNLNKNNIVVITAKGDSMHPTIISGEPLLVDTTPIDNFVDGIYVIDLDNHLLVKRLQRQFSGGVKILSDNPAYEAQLVPPENLNQLRVVGRVIWMGIDL
ncbi:XRE family transcriptional regulator [Pseudoalteromonas ruthenica]|uniref:XRE family transcriptional regulator n=1 Tax=Pseudoalteromonas ruthenica TaxID=151081 RepID=UPI00241C67CB|nr:LexA family transcriptional regulator [Pseudoalteromonas ruthenica]|tara:strand:+ start:23082 stop:23774 length:693 start_codon:yes stop_codon:yes gene_type:complete